MNLKAYSLRDNASDTFACPFFVPSDAVAKRVLTAMLQERGSQLSTYPNDFVLFRVGEYDTSSGVMLPTLIEQVCYASACLPFSAAEKAAVNNLLEKTSTPVEVN